MVEYVRLTQQESLSAQKNMLEVQMHSLTCMQALASYKKRRAEVLMLKIALKQKTSELKEQLALIDRLLPVTEYKHSAPKEFSAIQEKEEQREQRKGHLSLEEELAVIKQKLAKLT